nr:MAG TPA: hypothetical protein [Caudoviricetes sp.]
MIPIFYKHYIFLYPFHHENLELIRLLILFLKILYSVH